MANPFIKKILGVVIVFILVSLVLFFVFSSDEDDTLPDNGRVTLPDGTVVLPETPGTTPPQEPTDTPGETGDLGEQMPFAKLEKISEYAALDLWINNDTKEIFYITADGRVYNAKSGPDLEVSMQTIGAINKIEASPSGKLALASFGDPNAPQWGLFDSIDKVWKPLPNNISYSTWGESDSVLIATVKDGAKTNLSWVDASKSPYSTKKILDDFGIKNASFFYISPQKLVITERPSFYYQGRVWQLNLKTLSFNLVLAPENGLMLGFGQNKDAIFKYSSPIEFFVLDSNLQSKTDNFLRTFPDKCTFSASTTYCFVPDNIPWSGAAQSILPDDYLKNKLYTLDTLNTIYENEELGIVLIEESKNSEKIDGRHPIVDGKNVYFINKYDNQIYKLTLPESAQAE